MVLVDHPKLPSADEKKLMEAQWIRAGQMMRIQKGMELLDMTDNTLKSLKILIAVEASEFSHKALQQCLRLVNLAQAELLILTVEEPIMAPTTSTLPGVLGGDPTLVMQQEVEILKIEAQRAQSALDWAERACQQAGIGQYSIRSEFGDPKHLICEVAQQEAVDLIVVGSESHGFLDRLLTGSVSDFVVNHAHCSVLVIH
jgi:nucleotide-binding universal stress UspA family protein